MFNFIFNSKNKIKGVLAALLLVSNLLTTPGESTYILRYSTVADNGALVFGGNTLGLSKQVNQNQPGTSDAIGAFITLDTTQQVGNYPAGTTLDWTKNKSAAVLDIPAGATVLYAELIWSGSYGYLNEGAGVGENPNIILYPASTVSVYMTTPDQVVHAIQPDPATMQNVQNPTVNYSAGNYVRSANVTSIVQAQGGGTYSVGGVPATISALDNTHNAAGWTLAVAYRDPTLHTNNMSIFVGCEQASYDTNNPAAVTGFCVPPDYTGLSGRLYVSAIEADANKAGDHMEFGPAPSNLTSLSGPNNPVNNFFCSQINNSQGLLDTRGTFGTLNAVPPNNVNPGRQGYDITSVDLTSTLSSNQTAGYALGTTQGDDYTINALGIQIAVDAPVIQATKKVNGQDSVNVNVGDIVTFTITFQNTGASDAFEVSFKDLLETGLSFVPNTFKVDGTLVANPDLSGGVPLGDLSEHSSEVTIEFKVSVDEYPEDGTLVYYNSGLLNYSFVPCLQTDPIKLEAATNQVSLILPEIIPNPPFIQVVKKVNGQDAIDVHVGDIVTFTVAVQNSGYGTASSAVFSDILEAGITLVANSFKVDGFLVSNPDFVGGVSLGDVAPGGIINLEFQGKINAFPADGFIYYNFATIDYVYKRPDYDVNLVGESNQVAITVKQNDLPPPLMKLVEKVNGQDSVEVHVGDTVTFTVTFQNVGYGPASEVLFKNTLETGLLLLPNTFLVDGVLVPNPDFILGVPLGDFPAQSEIITVQFQAIVIAFPQQGSTYYNFTTSDYLYERQDQYPVTLEAESNEVSILVLQDNLPAPFLQAIEKVNGQNSVQVNIGDTVTLTISLQNIGYGTAYDVLFKNSLETGLTFVPNTFKVDNNLIANPDLNQGVPLSDIAPSGLVMIEFQVTVNAFPPQGNIYYNFSIGDYTYQRPDYPVSLEAQSNQVEIIVNAAPVPPEPPHNFRGRVSTCDFLNRSESYLEARWDPVSAAGLIGYRIYFGNELVEEISPTAPTVFKTCLGSKKSARNYAITAVYAGNIESTPVTIRFGHE